MCERIPIPSSDTMQFSSRPLRPPKANPQMTTVQHFGASDLINNDTAKLFAPWADHPKLTIIQKLAPPTTTPNWRRREQGIFQAAHINRFGASWYNIHLANSFWACHQLAEKRAHCGRAWVTASFLGIEERWVVNSIAEPGAGFEHWFRFCRRPGLVPQPICTCNPPCRSTKCCLLCFLCVVVRVSIRGPRSAAPLAQTLGPLSPCREKAVIYWQSPGHGPAMLPRTSLPP